MKEKRAISRQRAFAAAGPVGSFSRVNRDEERTQGGKEGRRKGVGREGSAQQRAERRRKRRMRKKHRQSS